MQEQSFDKLLSPGVLSEIKRIELRTRRSVTSSLSGQYRSAFRGSGLVFNDIREYMPGDDVKHIHWKVTARSGKVYVKSYEEDRELNIILALDISRSTIAGAVKSKHQRGLEFCAVLSMLAKINQDSLGLCLFSDGVDDYLRPSRSRSQIKRILLELLAERELPAATNVGSALSFLRTNLKKTSIIFIVSDFYTRPCPDELRFLALKHDVILVMLEDTLDRTLPPAGLVEFVDAETGERILVDASNKKTRAAIERGHERRVTLWRDACTAAKADFIAVHEHPLRALSNLMALRNQRVR